MVSSRLFGESNRRNALKTIYSRLTTMDESVTALESVGISVRDVNGEIKTASQIISELQQKWNDLSAEQQQNIAVTLAGNVSAP